MQPGDLARTEQDVDESKLAPTSAIRTIEVGVGNSWDRYREYYGVKA